MALGEFWETTPGEVMVVVYAAQERRIDSLETGIQSVWLGRVVSHMKKPNPAALLKPRRRRAGGSRPDSSARPIDVERTRSETARWRRKLAAQAVAEAEAKPS